jgi:hypothetical protein
MSRSNRRKGRENIPAGTATHVNNAAMIAAASVLIKNPAAARNLQKLIWNTRSRHESHQLLF